MLVNSGSKSEFLPLFTLFFLLLVAVAVTVAVAVAATTCVVVGVVFRLDRGPIEFEPLVEEKRVLGDGVEVEVEVEVDPRAARCTAPGQLPG